MLVEHNYLENSSEILITNNSNDEYLYIKFNLKLYNYHSVSSLFGDITLINNNFQVFTSLILCIVALICAILHIQIIIQRYCYKNYLSYYIFIQSLFDSCHLMNILFTHIIIIIVYNKISSDIDFYCPLSTFFFSLTSFGSTIFLCLGAFNHYMYLFKKQSQYEFIRQRSLAHRIILITSMGWLIINFPKIDLNNIFPI